MTEQRVRVIHDFIVRNDVVECDGKKVEIIRITPIMIVQDQ